jgi:electron transfer flavoprotein beta subunit
MKIVVCMKQVPDTTEVKIDPVTNTLIRDGVPAIINPDDKCGIEAALEIKERVPNTTVTVVTMGIPAAEIALREALAMGCDEAVLLTDRKLAGADTWATSCAVAGAVQKLGADLVVCGRQAIDGDTAQVGVQIAIHMGIPVTTYVEKLVEVDEKSITVQRQYEDRYQTVRMQYPCLITAIGDLNKPRYMSVGGCWDAYAKEIKVMTYADIADVADESNMGLAGSPTYVATSTTKEAKGAGTVLKDLSPDEAVAAIVDKLAAMHII